MKHYVEKQQELDGSLVLVPQSFLANLSHTQEQILALLKDKQDPAQEIPGGYLTEQEAKKLLGRKATWFWQKRTSCQLAYTKIGNQVYYAKKDIQALLDSCRKEAAIK